MISTIQAVPSSADCNYEHRIKLVFVPALAILPSTCALGDLFIDSSAMYFRSCSNASLVLKIEYLSIQIHALARGSDDTQGHIYCQLDLLHPPALQNEVSTDEEIVYEMQLIPENSLILDQMFEEMSVASALHPGSSNDEDTNLMGTGMGLDSEWITAETLANDAKLSEDASELLDNIFEKKQKLDDSIYEDAEK